MKPGTLCRSKPSVVEIIDAYTDGLGIGRVEYRRRLDDGSEILGRLSRVEFQDLFEPVPIEPGATVTVNGYPGRTFRVVRVTASFPAGGSPQVVATVHPIHAGRVDSTSSRTWRVDRMKLAAPSK